MDNLDRWNAAKFTRSTQINTQAAKIAANRARYEAVSEQTGVPWDVIGVIHYREASGSFAGVLHNGDRIIGKGTKTTSVPKGRGPFATWEEAAVDALMNTAPYAGKNTDWSIGGTLDLLEKYNGLGYRNKGVPSPYLWAGTDQYTKGKYVADGEYDPNHVDKQLGVAPILMKLRGTGAQVPAHITDPATVARVQEQLWALGYTEVGSKRPDGTFDGKIGTLTRSAILSFRNENDLPDGAFIDDAMLAKLWTAKPRAIAPSRADAAPAVVREQVPEARAAWRNKMGAWVVGAPAAVGAVVSGVLDNLDGARGYLEPVKAFVGDVPPWVWFVIIGGGAFALWQNSRKAEQASVAAFQTGERR